MCISCLSQKVNITEGLSRNETLQYCTKCGRYNRPPWMVIEPESRELLAMCLKKIKGLRKVKLIDAGFLYTEPHSRRLKVKLTVQKEEYGVLLQQSIVVEFVIQYSQCLDCIREACNQAWDSVVQVRQKVEHKRTFYYLEQLIIKHNMQKKCIKIETQPDGIDFYFNHRSHAKGFIEFLKSVVPMIYKDARQLVSQDLKSNIYNFKYAYTCTIVPVCKDDLCVLPVKTASALGVSPLVICDNICQMLFFVDPFTLKRVMMDTDRYFQHPFDPLLSLRMTTEFVVIDIETVHGNEAKEYVSGHYKYQLADVTVARIRDFGVNDIKFTVRSHLGFILKSGDCVLGYDTECCVFNDSDARQLLNKLPPVILLKKCYPKFRQEIHNRAWKLRGLHYDDNEDNNNSKKAKGDKAKAERDYELFMRELEEDPEMRAKVNIIKDKEYFQSHKEYSKDELLKAHTDLEEDIPLISTVEMRDEEAFEEEQEGEDDKEDGEIIKEPELPKSDGKLFTEEELADL